MWYKYVQQLQHCTTKVCYTDIPKIGTNAPKSCMSQSLWYNCIASNHYICILFTRPKITTKTRKKQVIICRQQYYLFSSLSIPKPSFKKVQTYLHYTSHSSLNKCSNIFYKRKCTYVFIPMSFSLAHFYLTI